MLSDYPHVFSPLRIGPMAVANRIFMPPHGIPLVAPGPHGTRVPSVPARVPEPLVRALAPFTTTGRSS